MHALRQMLRSLVRTPGFVVVVVVTLAVGIGGVTTIFDLANTFHWRRPAVPDAGEVVEVYTTGRQQAALGPYGLLSWPDYTDYRSASTSVVGLAAYSNLFANLESPSGTEEAEIAAVSGNYFAVLGLRPALGRLLEPSDDRPGAAPAAVLSHAAWQALGGDPGLVGQPLRLAGAALYVIGVAPARFHGMVAGSRPGVYVPSSFLFEHLEPSEDARSDRTAQSWSVVGRLAPGGDRRSLEAELAVVAQRLDREHPIPSFERVISVLPATLGHPVDQFRMRRTFLVFGIAVGLLLLIVCANVASLLLSRAFRRQREAGIRQSLGASRAVLVRSAMLESTVLAIAGGALALPVALATRRFLALYFGPELTQDMRLDVRVVGLTMLTALGSAWLFGAVPALAGSRADPFSALKGSPGVPGRTRWGGRSVLVVVQLALSLVLLVSSALLLGTVGELLSVDRGFEGRDLLMARVDVEQAGYEPEAGRRLFRELRERAASIPGVRSAGVALLVPPVLFDANVRLQLPEEPELTHAARFNTVDDGYFETMGLELLEGRLFSLHDGDRGRGVAVVNQRLASELWPGESAVGRVLGLERRRPGDPGTEYDVVGVVSSVAWYAASREPEPVFYTSWEQRFRSGLWVLLRTDDIDAGGVLTTLRAELRDLDPSLALTLEATHEQHRRQALVVQRLQSATVTLFCVVGVLLALLGVFAVTSQTVDEQVHQIGIRMAIGARRTDIQIWVLRRAVALGLLGSVLGLAASFWSIGLLRRSVEGVGTVGTDVVLGAVVVLIGSGILAAWLPARRAARLDPLRALRRE